MLKKDLDPKVYLIFTVLLLTVFFLSCTKKPDTTAQANSSNAARKPAADGMYQTPSGYKVQIEPAQITQKQ